MFNLLHIRTHESQQEHFCSTINRLVNSSFYYLAITDIFHVCINIQPLFITFSDKDLVNKLGQIIQMIIGSISENLKVKNEQASVCLD